MKTISKVQTLDGSLFDSEPEARRHAEKVYGEALSKLAHQISQLQKYSLTMDFIDANLGSFVALDKLKADIWMEAESQ